MMSRSRSVSVSLLAVSLLLTVVCEAQYYEDATPSPDYENDYNATFDYSFFSNTSHEELERFREQFLEEEEEEDTGGQQEQEDVTVTMTTPGQTTERGRFDVRNAASLPVSLEIRTLVWTLISLMVLNTQQLRHTL